MIADFLLETDIHSCLVAVHWLSTTLEKDWGDSCFPLGTSLQDLNIPSAPQGVFNVKARSFHYQKVSLTCGGQQVLCRLESDHYHLLQDALNMVSHGVQIYDREGNVVFFNHISRQISSVPEQTEIQGKHLTQLYELDPEVSTVLTTLRAGVPVRNRLDTFDSTHSSQIITANSAYPVHVGGEVVGAVLFEHDKQAVAQQIEALKQMQDQLEVHKDSLIGFKFNGYNFDDIFYQCPLMEEAVSLAKRFSVQHSNVLLIGETGTGKELFAQSIHKNSSRTTGKFVAINCAAVPDTLIESILFGTKKGAFTGSEERTGLFEEANKGTLFLDELNSMSPGMQAKLLRVVQEGVFRPVGDQQDHQMDVRIISSCNESPEMLVSEGKLRRDLFYRLSSVQVHIPPLRKRTGDITALAYHYLQMNKFRFSKPLNLIHPDVLAIFETYHWPGNVRELYHVLEYALNVTEGDLVDIACLPAYLREEITPPTPQHSLPKNVIDQPLDAIMGEYEAQVLHIVLDHHGGNISRSAQALGISRQSLAYRIRKYGLII